MNESVGEPSVEEVMSEELDFIEPDASVQEAAKLLRSNDGRGSLLVKENNEIKGILTNSDIVNKYVAQERGERVKDVMTLDLVTISPEKTIDEAALIMVKKGVERLPVMDDGELVGIVSANDIIKIQPSLYLDLTQGLKLGEERFERAPTNRDVGQCESCENYSENLDEVNGQLLCEKCREEFL